MTTRAPELGASPRVALARTALSAALATDGVVGSDSGPVGLFVTMDRGERLVGVSSAAAGEDRYALTLHLVARLVPLPALAERVRDEIERAARSADLAGFLDAIDIAFVDVAEPHKEQVAP